MSLCSNQLLLEHFERARSSSLLCVGYYNQIDSPVAAVEEKEEGGEDIGGTSVQVHLEPMQRRL